MRRKADGGRHGRQCREAGSLRPSLPQGGCTDRDEQHSPTRPGDREGKPPTTYNHKGPEHWPALALIKSSSQQGDSKAEMSSGKGKRRGAGQGRRRQKNVAAEGTGGRGGKGSSSGAAACSRTSCRALVGSGTPARVGGRSRNSGGGTLALLVLMARRPPAAAPWPRPAAPRPAPALPLHATRRTRAGEGQHTGVRGARASARLGRLPFPPQGTPCPTFHVRQAPKVANVHALGAAPACA